MLVYRRGLYISIYIQTYSIGSMYGIFTYIWLIFVVNVGKYPINGSHGYDLFIWYTVHILAVIFFHSSLYCYWNCMMINFPWSCFCSGLFPHPTSPLRFPLILALNLDVVGFVSGQWFQIGNEPEGPTGKLQEATINKMKGWVVMLKLQNVWFASFHKWKNI